MVAAKEEGEVIFYSWWGEHWWKITAQQFQEKYEIDAILVGGAAAKTFMESKVLYGPILPITPNSDKLDPKLSKIQEGLLTNGYLVPIYRNQTGLLYDPQRASNPPQTWDDDTTINLNKGTLLKRAKLYIPKMGFTGGGDTAGVLKNAPHKTAGLLFMAYLTEAEAQIQMNETIGSFLARTEVQGKVALLSEAVSTLAIGPDCF